jgi:hypothetical protein
MTIPVLFAGNAMALSVALSVCLAAAVYLVAAVTRIQVEIPDAAT